MMVQHHKRYEEIHGKDEIVMMDYAEHKKLHVRLRKEGKCTIPAKELHKIVRAAHARTEKGKETKRKVNQRAGIKRRKTTKEKRFTRSIDSVFYISTRVLLTLDNGDLFVYAHFSGRNGRKLIYIDI